MKLFVLMKLAKLFTMTVEGDIDGVYYCDVYSGGMLLS